MITDLSHIRGALIDMDGVLYDSMKFHTLAWHRMMTEIGINCTREEFYLYEGMTGIATINLLMNRERRTMLSEEECKRLYEIKSGYFRQFGRHEPMPGADCVLKILKNHEITRVLVTGSAQSSLLDKLDSDYPGAFRKDMRITALDVIHGKPEPEPYLKAMQKAGLTAGECIVIENAPLGVRSGKAAGCFTIAVMTGPIPKEEFVKEKADLIFPSMTALAEALPEFLEKSTPIPAT